jgi:hypothetical protein
MNEKEGKEVMEDMVDVTSTAATTTTGRGACHPFIRFTEILKNCSDTFSFSLFASSIFICLRCPSPPDQQTDGVAISVRIQVTRGDVFLFSLFISPLCYLSRLLLQRGDEVEIGVVPHRSKGGIRLKCPRRGDALETHSQFFFFFFSFSGC